MKSFRVVVVVVQVVQEDGMIVQDALLGQVLVVVVALVVEKDRIAGILATTQNVVKPFVKEEVEVDRRNDHVIINSFFSCPPVSYIPPTLISCRCDDR